MRNETCGWHVCAGRVKHVDISTIRSPVHVLMRAATAGRVDAPRGPEVGEHAPEGITIRVHFRVEALRQNGERAGKPRR